MHYFHYKNGELFCEQTPVAALAREFGTPLYVYSRQTIVDHYRRLDAALAPLDHAICYATKANSNLAVIRLLSDLGGSFDIVSAGELFRVIQAGGDPRKCVFAGVGKTEDEIRYALQNDIYCFNVESEAEIDRIQKIASAMNKRAPIAVRVNPDVEAHTHRKITTGRYENKFGVQFEKVLGVYSRAAKMSHIELRGVQMHIGSQITSVKPFVDAVKRMTPLAARLKKRFGIRSCSIGGGIGIVYNPALESGTADWWSRETKGRSRRTTGRRQQPLDDNPLPMTIADYAGAVVPLLQPLGLKILVEPGRFIVGNAGILVMRVEYLKKTAHKNFIIVDAAMNDLIRPAFYDAYHEIVPLKQRKKGKVISADIVGPVCESGDFLALDRRIVAPRQGDYLAALSAGAYGFTMASNYNSRPRPAEVLVHADTHHLVRRRETLNELISAEIVPCRSCSELT
jgi:diaminopimelate decarboxylase